MSYGLGSIDLVTCERLRVGVFVNDVCRVIGRWIVRGGKNEMAMRETTYRRLKRENLELRRKLFELVMNPDGIVAALIKREVRCQHDVEQATWQGNSECCGSSFEGLIPYINKH